MKRKLIFFMLINCLLAGKAFCQINIFMKVSGYNGATQAAGFPNYFAVAKTGQTNTTCSTASCAATAGDFTVEMPTNTSSDLTVPLQQKLFQGPSATLIPTVDIVFATSTTSASVFYQVHLTNVRVKTIAQVSEEEGLDDQISFTFETISWKFKSSAGTVTTGCWNVSGNASCTASGFPF